MTGQRNKKNKLAKARKTRKSPGSLGLGRFQPGKALGQKGFDFLTKLDGFKTDKF